MIIYILLLLSIALSEANHFVCQNFNYETKTLGKYCEEFGGSIPNGCAREIEPIALNEVEQLKIGGCDRVTVLDSLERFSNVRTLDISYSEQKTLDWLDFGALNVQKVNASHNQLTKLAVNASELIEIDLSHNQWKRIDANCFSGAVNLVRLFMSYNAISSVDSEAFADLTELEFLDLSGNRFWSIPVFTINKRLHTIRFDGNPILTFDCSKVSALSSVQLYFPWRWAISLHGDGNCNQKPLHVRRDYINEGLLMTPEQQYEIHCNEQSFANLTIVVAGRNSFENIADLLQCFGPTIMHMDLSGNLIGKLNTAIFDRFTQLIVLSLSETMLIDFDFRALKHVGLMKLDVSRNNLKHLQNVRFLESFSRLEELDIAENQLENVPDLIQHLNPSMQRLNVAGNFVGSLNSLTFEWLTALTNLNLSNTKLEMFDFSAFLPLQNLSTLDISYNNLTHVNFTKIANLSQLNHLNAAYCQIANVSHALIQHLNASIRVLNLAGNNFRTVDEFTFKMLVHLEHLNISNTNILNLDLSFLQYQKNLHTLDISNNQFHELNAKLLTNHLDHIYANGNDLNDMKHFDRSHFLQLKSIAIAQNRLSCAWIKTFKSQWPELTFVGNPFEQKHGKNCQSKFQAINDFIDSTYNHLAKFW